MALRQPPHRWMEDALRTEDSSSSAVKLSDRQLGAALAAHLKMQEVPAPLLIEVWTGARGRFGLYHLDHCRFIADFRRRNRQSGVYARAASEVAGSSRAVAHHSTSSWRAAFERADMDRSGTLDAAELAAALHDHLDLSSNAHDAVELIRRYDTEAKGSLSIFEYARLASDVQRWRGSPLPGRATSAPRSSSSTMGQNGKVQMAPSSMACHPSTPSALRALCDVLDCSSEGDAMLQRQREDVLFRDFDPNGNGKVSLSECGAGVLAALSRAYGKRAHAMYTRFYRSYIRGFNTAQQDAKQANPNEVVKRVSTRRHGGDGFITRSTFRRLLFHLCLSARWLECFRLADGTAVVTGPTSWPTGQARSHSTPKPSRNSLTGVQVDEDNRISRQEWEAALGKLRRAGATWATSERLRHASVADFDAMDRNGGGYVDLREFCEWMAG